MILNAEILRDVNIGENRLINHVTTLGYFGQVMRHSGLGRTVLEGMVPERRGRGDKCRGEHRTLETP